jgi:hypothetical protein
LEFSEISAEGPHGADDPKGIRRVDVKNQYFGDVNDYRKYGLLRCFQSVGVRRLLVAWMLTSDDGGRDGGRRSYLDSPQRWIAHDSVLYTGLQKLLRGGRPPTVTLLEDAGLLPRASFYSASVPDGRPAREVWLDGLLAAARGADLVFLDPDNGLEVPSSPMGRKGSSKFVFWSELESLWRAGCSVLVYQHFRRERHTVFASRITTELSWRTGARVIEAFRTSHVLFMFMAQERHASVLSAVCSRLNRHWAGQIAPMGLADRLSHHSEGGCSEAPTAPRR